MTKKGYQKRLPTVLVPAPRAAPEQERAPETQPEARPPVPPVPHEERPTPAGRPARYAGRIHAADALGLVVVLAVGVWLMSMLVVDEPSGSGSDGRAAAFATPPPVPVGPGESYVELDVVADGDVEATHWIAAAEPLDRLRLELPELAGAEGITASVVTVLADGELIAGPNRLTRGGVTYALDSASNVQVSYRLTGAVVLSGSVTGRALAAAGIGVGYEPRSRREIRVVRAPGVLSLACGAPASERLVPCGKETGPEEWTVDLTEREVDDRVVVQLDLE